jgi:hypothetical protein
VQTLEQPCAAPFREGTQGYGLGLRDIGGVRHRLKADHQVSDAADSVEDIVDDLGDVAHRLVDLLRRANPLRGDQGLGQGRGGALAVELEVGSGFLRGEPESPNRGRIVLEGFEVRLDVGERVVDLVSDTGRQPSCTARSLRLDELLAGAEELVDPSGELAVELRIVECERDLRAEDATATELGLREGRKGR